MWNPFKKQPSNKRPCSCGEGAWVRPYWVNANYFVEKGWVTRCVTCNDRVNLGMNRKEAYNKLHELQKEAKNYVEVNSDQASIN